MIHQLFKTLRLPNRVSFALLILRLVAGLAFMYHGYGKIQNPFSWGGDAGIPPIFQALASIAEFGGGLAWILGIVTPLASLGILCTMAVAVMTHVSLFNDPFVSMTGGGSYELASIYLCIAFLFLLAGPGRFSMDRLIFGEKG